MMYNLRNIISAPFGAIFPMDKVSNFTCYVNSSNFVINWDIELKFLLKVPYYQQITWGRVTVVN